jgi:uncharacterized Zn finger protein
MSGGLDTLTESDISARCTEAIFDRGWRYYVDGAVRERMRNDDSLAARVTGTEVYRVTVRKTPSGLSATCTCPYRRGGDCKHVVATLLAWLREPDTFRPPDDT